MNHIIVIDKRHLWREMDIFSAIGIRQACCTLQGAGTTYTINT